MTQRIFRRPIRSAGVAAATPTEQVEHCLREGIVGLGWALEPPPPTSLDEALRRTRAQPGWKGADHTIRRFATAPEGSLIWTRHPNGRFLVGEICGPWHYDGSEAATRVDVHHLRPVEWASPVLAEAVPGAVIRAFSARGSSFSEIHNEAARGYSRYLFNSLIGRPTEALQVSAATVLRDLLAPFDVEDLVYVFLQVQEGYVVLPASRRTDTAAYEYELVHRNSGQRAVVQVKTGDSRVDLSVLGSTAGKTDVAFAYATKGGYEGHGGRRVRVIQDGELLGFARTHPELLPARVRHWFDRVETQ